MNVSSDKVRQELRTFDGGIFGPKISKTALLRDGQYFVPTPEDMKFLVGSARQRMATLLAVKVGDLATIWEDNGRWDCDNYAILGCAMIKALHDVRCRLEGRKDDAEYAIWPVARADMEHTQALCLTMDGWYFIEFMTGESWSMREFKPELLIVG